MLPLTESLAMQRRFVADASHELRTPLTLLSTRLQLVARRARHRGEGLGADALDGVLADTGRLTEILDDLLLAADTRAAERTRLDLAALARECVDAAAGTADDRGVTLMLLAPTEVVRGRRRHRPAAGCHCARRQCSRPRADPRRGPRRGPVGHRDGHGHRRRARHRRVRARPGSSNASPVTGTPLRRRLAGTTASGLALVADVATSHGGAVSAANRQGGSSGAVLTLTLPLLPGGALGG